jgi:hypothetical protein
MEAVKANIYLGWDNRHTWSILIDGPLEKRTEKIE